MHEWAAVLGEEDILYVEAVSLLFVHKNYLVAEKLDD